MIKIQKLLVLASLGLGVVSLTDAPAFAKNGARAGHHADALGLSKDQKQQLKPIRQEAKSQVAALKADTNLSKKERRARSKAIRSQSRSRASAILTPNQQRMIAQRRADHKAAKRAAKQGA